MTPYNPELRLDLSWRAGWPRSMISFFAWVEDLIFKDDYYTQLRTAIRHSKSPVGFMEYDTVAIKWKSIVDMRHAEQEAAKNENCSSCIGARGCALRGKLCRRCACAADK